MVDIRRHLTYLVNDFRSCMLKFYMCIVVLHTLKQVFTIVNRKTCRSLLYKKFRGYHLAFQYLVLSYLRNKLGILFIEYNLKILQSMKKYIT